MSEDEPLTNLHDIKPWRQPVAEAHMVLGAHWHQVPLHQPTCSAR